MSNDFVGRLKEATEVLARFIQPVVSGAKRWDGKAYVPVQPADVDVQAAKWWGLLTAIAELISKQAGSPSQMQKEYLERLLFGGMGSFNDFALDEGRFGSAAHEGNRELIRIRKEILAEFQKILK